MTSLPPLGPFRWGGAVHSTRHNTHFTLKDNPPWLRLCECCVRHMNLHNEAAIFNLFFRDHVSATGHLYRHELEHVHVSRISAAHVAYVVLVEKVEVCGLALAALAAGA